MSEAVGCVRCALRAVYLVEVDRPDKRGWAVACGSHLAAVRKSAGKDAVVTSLDGGEAPETTQLSMFDVPEGGK